MKHTKKKYADTFTQCVSILYMKIRFFQQKKEIFQDYFYIIRIFAEDAVPITEDTAMSGCSDRRSAAADGDTVHTLLCYCHTLSSRAEKILILRQNFL